MKILGLKLDKWRQWREVLREEGRAMSWRDWAGMVWFGIKIPFTADRKLWRERMRTCPKCPIFDKRLRRCRAYHNGQSFGCGCWTVLLALTNKGCWARHHAPDGAIGWKR